MEYSGLEQTARWRTELAAGTQEIVDAHSNMLGPVATVFWDCMYLICFCLREPLYRAGGLTDSVDRAKLALLTHTFHLLLTSWDAALQGRFGAAANNARSVSEAPAYLVAIHLDPDFAEKWINLRAAPTVWEARSAAANAMNRIRPGQGDAWRTSQERFHKEVQVYSHINATTALASVGWRRGKVAVGFGGAVDGEKLDAFTGLFANAALVLLAACGTAMSNMLLKPEHWDTKAKRVFAEGNALIQAKAFELKIRKRDVLEQIPALKEASGGLRKRGSRKKEELETGLMWLSRGL